MVYLTGDPFLEDPKTCLTYIEDGILVIEEGIIIASGSASDVLKTLDVTIPVVHYFNGIILPGFIDTHIH